MSTANELAAIERYHERYTNGDVTLILADKVAFKIERHYLTAHSPLAAGDPTVHFADASFETATSLTICLDHIVRSVRPDDAAAAAASVMAAYRFADKYDFAMVRELLRANLLSGIASSPRRVQDVFALAAAVGDVGLYESLIRAAGSGVIASV
ncbi:hypothetical protein Q5752_005805 [Cryptotrichosporon argae]